MLKKSQTAHRIINGEQGVALLFCIFALLILTAITASLIMMSGTETSVNANYRTEEIAFFAAKTGVYEALDRMQQSNASSIATNVPTAVPSNTGGVLYLINAGSSLTVKPWDETNAYYDTEFCHEGYTLTGMTSRPPDVPCFADTTAGTHALPTVSTWYTQVTSNYPWSGTSAAMPYVWVRINWKENKTQSYVSGGTTPAASNYAVNSGTGVPAGTPACWNGASEKLLSTPTGVTPPYTSCEQYQTCGVAPSISTPVLVITALAVTSNGSRQMVQAEAALNPPTIHVPSTCSTSDAYGFFAYGQGFSCSNPSFQFGGNASVDGYNSALGPYNPPSNGGTSLGDIGTNQGMVLVGHSTKVGHVFVPNDTAPGPPPVLNAPGGCPDDFSTSGGASYVSVAQSPAMPVPTVSVPPNTSSTNASSGTIFPGNFHDISVSNGATLTLTAPGNYVVDCITMGSSGSITTSPSSKAITIYVTGNSCASTPISMNSHATINNSSGVSGNVVIVYGGTGELDLQGGPQMCAIVNAPNAAVKFNGGSDYFGTIMANSIDDHGGVNLHYDTADATIPGVIASTATATATGSYNILALHSLPY